MNDQKNKKSISESVLSKIKEGKVKMHSRIYFIFRMILLVLGLVGISAAAIFLVSFIFFSMRQGGSLFLPQFGFSGIKILFLSLPWILIFGAVALIVTSEFFAKHFSFVYRSPILYSFSAIALVIILMGVILNFTPIHMNLFLSAQEGKLPFAGGFYREFGAPKISDVFYGSVLEIKDSGFIISTLREKELEVITDKNTRILNKNINENDNIIILGKKNGQTIHAFNVKKVDEKKGFFTPPNFPKRQPIDRVLK